MDNDREMLELAAKAAGIDAEWHNPDDADYDAANDGLWLKGARTPDNDSYWNPLRRDGDALRLAVKCHMGISIPHEGWADVVTFRGPLVSIHEPAGDAPYTATRRAIVRAAAEIGKAMP